MEHSPRDSFLSVEKRLDCAHGPRPGAFGSSGLCFLALYLKWIGLHRPFFPLSILRGRHPRFSSENLAEIAPFGKPTESRDLPDVYVEVAEDLLGQIDSALTYVGDESLLAVFREQSGQVVGVNLKEFGEPRDA